MQKTTLPYYVAIGASAGGLEAIATFFKQIPVDSGMIFVVIQHLSPDYKSMMDELLSRVTELPVEVVKDGVEPQPNHIYLIPPGCNMTIFHGKLLLEQQDRSTSMINLPIDVFFSSLAQDQGRNVIGIVMSGTGSDGTRGCRAIKDAGGLIMVQSESSAKFSGMPKSVISNGLVDFVMAVEELPEQLLQYARHQLAGTLVEQVAVVEEKGALSRIFSMLRSKTKIDFTLYKPPTIMRRIHRRMSIVQMNTLDEYADFMLKTPSEQLTLFRELLVGVTNFFRDREAFELLQDEYLRNYIEQAKFPELRLWIAGCSTGEEVYTFCIMLRETCELLGRSLDFKVFATDIDQDALTKASNGLYSESIAADIPHILLHKYFVHKDEGYQVTHQLREMVVFARHDLIKDPPFTNIDVLSCRNLLIYFQPHLQRRILDTFNFSLRPGGLMLLGSSESLGEAEPNFEVLNQKWKLFRSRGNRKELPRTSRFSPLDPIIDPNKWPISSNRAGEVRLEDVNILESFVERVMGHFIPFSMIVGTDNELIRVVGDSGRYLKPISGRVTTDVSKLLIKELCAPVLTGLSSVFKNQTEINFSNVSIKHEGKTRKINIFIKPLEVRRNQLQLAAVMISEAESVSEQAPREGSYDADVGIMQRIEDLEQELEFSRESLQATIEKLETSNEELQATNEELLASNEELQSTNEELQSVNEELFTLNTEFQSKISEMSELNADLQNFMAASQTVALFLGMDGAIRRFTLNAKSILNILEHDIGRPFAHISHRLLRLDLHACIQRVIADGTIFERQVQSDSDNWYHLRIMPYLVNNNQAGVIVVMHEINVLRAAQNELLRASRRSQLAQALASSANWTWHVNDKAMVWSANVETTLGITAGTMNKEFEAFISCIHPEDRTVFESEMAILLQQGTPFTLDLRVIYQDASCHWIRQQCTPIHDELGKTEHVLGMIHNIDDFKADEEQANASQSES